MPARAEVREVTVRGTGARLVGAPDAPVVAVLGGISAHRHVASHAGDTRPGWWEWLVGTGRPLDPAAVRVLSLDWAVADVGPTTTHGQAALLVAALDALGVEQLALVVGASYGGMVALAAAEQFPRRVGRLAVISAAHVSHPMATAHRLIQRRILALAGANGHAREGLAIARALAITTYRTRHEFAERFTATEAGTFPVAAYLDHCGARFAEAWTPERYHALSESVDLHRVRPEAVTVPTHLLAVRDDTLVTLEQVHTLHRTLGGPSTLEIIASPYGHDAFLKEQQAVTAFLASIPPLAPPPAERPRGREAGGPASPTTAVRAGIATDRHHGAVVPPIHLSSTYAFEGLGRKRPYDYTRTANPTRDLLAEAIAELEGGAGAIVTSSGMSAVLLALQLVEPVALVVAPHDCYGGTHRALTALAARGDFRLRQLDLSAADAPARVAAARPALVWIETPSNPLLRITDIRAVAAAARRSGALVVVDNTFLSPALQQPITLGADCVVHSTTKYLNGHSDVVGGAVVAADPALHERLAWWANCLGLSGAPFDAFLTLRGIRTLHARMRVHLENAGRLARLLSAHPAVSHTHWPGLETHPGHHLACRQQSGHGAMLSFELAGGLPAVERVLGGLRHFTLAESLGGVESLIAHPATMTHAAMGADARHAAGISDALLRISVGIEDGADLEADLQRALNAAV